jgi:hypothetical protein
VYSTLGPSWNTQKHTKTDSRSIGGPGAATKSNEKCKKRNKGILYNEYRNNKKKLKELKINTDRSRDTELMGYKLAGILYRTSYIYLE